MVSLKEHNLALVRFSPVLLRMVVCICVSLYVYRCLNAYVYIREVHLFFDLCMSDCMCQCGSLSVNL